MRQKPEVEKGKTMEYQKGKADFAFSSDAPSTWSLIKKGSEPWMHITLACSNKQSIVSTVSTNDPELVKRTLAAPGEGLCVRSFQAVFSCDFPDNIGIGVADVFELREARTKRGELFHSLHTKFGVFRFGGPIELMANQVEFGSDVAIYTAKRPRQRYFGN